MPIIFLSYRRSDSQDVTGRIYDRLIATYNKKQVFKDVDNIPLGVSFPMHLQQVLGKASMALVIIGPNWVNSTDEEGGRRLDDPGDFVRIEVETALRSKIPVIPILVSNAKMPQAKDLPPSLRGLVMRHGLAVRPDPDFNTDIERLLAGIEQLSKLLSGQTEKAGRDADQPIPWVIAVVDDNQGDASSISGRKKRSDSVFDRSGRKNLPQSEKEIVIEVVGDSNRDGRGERLSLTAPPKGASNRGNSGRGWWFVVASGFLLSLVGVIVFGLIYSGTISVEKLGWSSNQGADKKAIEHRDGAADDWEAWNNVDAFLEEAEKKDESKGVPKGNDPKDLYRKALATKDPKAAIALLRDSANLGFAPAQYSLGNRYYFGKEVPKDGIEAVNWYRKAAEQGNADAQDALGVCLATGFGIVKDEGKAYEWYRKAADQGHSGGQLNAGNCLLSGKGVLKNQNEGIELIRKSADKGHPPAQYQLGLCYSFATGVAKDEKLADEWIRKAAEKGYAKAQSSLGYRYSVGRGVEKDLAHSFQWYKKAAVQGLPSAQYTVGMCLERGIGVTADRTEAVAWYRKAAKGEYSPAISALTRLGVSP